MIKSSENQNAENSHIPLSNRNIHAGDSALWDDHYELNLFSLQDLQHKIQKSLILNMGCQMIIRNYDPGISPKESPIS